MHLTSGESVLLGVVIGSVSSLVGTFITARISRSTSREQRAAARADQNWDLERKTYLAIAETIGHRQLARDVAIDKDGDVPADSPDSVLLSQYEPRFNDTELAARINLYAQRIVRDLFAEASTAHTNALAAKTALDTSGINAQPYDHANLTTWRNKATVLDDAVLNTIYEILRLEPAAGARSGPLPRQLQRVSDVVKRTEKGP